MAAAIVAGGAAKRLAGADKGQLLVGDESIRERQLRLLLPRFSRVLLIGSLQMPSPAATEPRVVAVQDRVGGRLGPLAGIDAALAALLPEEDAVVCIAGDMPMLIAPLLELLRDIAPEASAVLPRISGQAEPLLARYGRASAPAIAAALAAGERKARQVVTTLAPHWLDEAELRQVDPELASFTNINTPEDLARAQPRRP